MIGSSLGPYKILEQLGVGGMGEVFLAEDTRLNRKVAVKVLPAEFASDRERLARFEQEAKAAAALNHPHIAVVHDIGFQEGGAESDGATNPDIDLTAVPSVGVHYMVQEYLEGGTLRDPLKKGALPLNKALLFAREVAEGLAAAHDAGIVHRDLKPDNVFITKDGHAKILDFGLAKLTEISGPGGKELSMSPTVLGTVAGQVMGTAGYMAPEQIESEEEIDSRADLFAFGCLLYEMIGGKRAFGGDSVLDTLHAIARSEPQPVGEIDPELPADLERIVKKCLAKDRDQRYQSAADILVDLRNLSSEVEAGTVRTVADRAASGGAAPAAGGVSWAVAAPVLLAVAVVAGGLAWLAKPAPEPDLRMFRYDLGLPGGVSYSALALKSIAMSPQGTHVAVAAANEIYLRALDEAESSPVRGTEGGLVPFFSPDGQSIGFWSGGELRKVTIGGGAAVKIADVPNTPAGVSWAADDTILYSHSGAGIFRVPSDGGEPVAVIEPQDEEFHMGPQQLPNGKILLTRSSLTAATWDDGEVVVWDPESEAMTVLVSGGRDPRYLPTGHLVYALDDAILARTFDPETLEVGGAVPVMQGVAGAAAGSGVAHFDTSSQGDIVFIAGDNQSQQFATFVWRDDDNDKAEVAVANDSGRAWTPRLSPDGRYIAYRVSGTRGDNIWMLDLERNIHSLFTPDGGARSFAWSPHGDYLYYSADTPTENGVDIYRRPADMRSDAESFVSGPGNEFVRSISADGNWLVFADTDVINTGAYDIKVMSLTEPGDPSVMFDREVQEVTASISPNGKWVAYAAGPQGDRRVFVQGFPNLGGITQISDGHGDEPLWARDSSRLFYRSNTDIMVVDVVNDEPFDVSAPELYLAGVLFAGDTQNAGSYDISLDDELLLMVDWGDGNTGEAGSYSVILNWFRELQERAPTDGR